jgi:hypothetical protein
LKEKAANIETTTTTKVPKRTTSSKGDATRRVEEHMSRRKRTSGTRRVSKVEKKTRSSDVLGTILVVFPTKIWKLLGIFFLKL